MKRNSLRRAPVLFAAALSCLAGCQYLGFQGGSGAAHTTQDGDVQKLSKRQRCDVQLSLGRSLETRGETEGAMRAYRDAAQTEPKRAESYWRLAVLNDRQGHVKDSEPLYRKALEADPGNADIFCDCGYSQYLQHRWAEAEANLRQALTLKPRHLRAHNNLGLVLAQTEREDEAVSEFQKAGCDESDARTNLAFVLTLNRNWDGAREQYQLALAAKPNSAAAKAGLDKLESVAAKDVAAKDAGAKEVAAKNVAAKDVGAKAVASQDVAAKPRSQPSRISLASYERPSTPETKVPEAEAGEPGKASVRSAR